MGRGRIVQSGPIREEAADMQVNITFRHLEPTEALKSHAREKVEHV